MQKVPGVEPQGDLLQGRTGEIQDKPGEKIITTNYLCFTLQQVTNQLNTNAYHSRKFSSQWRCTGTYSFHYPGRCTGYLIMKYHKKSEWKLACDVNYNNK